MYTDNDWWRKADIPPKDKLPEEPYRTRVRRDYARVLHSPSFRRLEGKTQLFSGDESDFFRNRLTHSLEVAQLAKDIAIKINTNPELIEKGIEINPDICEIAGLVHDLGHPPFGHNGERALDDCMKQYGGFEGNAQTIRILTKLEKKERVDQKVIDDNGEDTRIGLNLTARVIASALKYDNCIEYERTEKCELSKGFYKSEKEIIDTIKSKVLGRKPTKGQVFKTVECQIMDIADDISYSTYDLEDAFKAGFLTPYDLISADEKIIEEIAKKLKKPITTEEIRNTIIETFGAAFALIINNDQKAIKPNDDLYFEKTIQNFINAYQSSKTISSDGYTRNQFSSFLVSMFLDGIEFSYDEKNPSQSKVKLNEKIELKVNVLKHFSYVALINSSKLKISEFRGYDIVQSIFTTLANYNHDGYKLIPEDFQNL
jgi:dGTPase